MTNKGLKIDGPLSDEIDRIAKETGLCFSVILRALAKHGIANLPPSITPGGLCQIDRDYGWRRMTGRGAK